MDKNTAEKRAKLKLLLALEKKTQQEMRDALEKAYKMSADFIAENGYFSEQGGYYAVLKFQQILARHYRRVETVFARRALIKFAEIVGGKLEKKSFLDKVTIKIPVRYANAFNEFITSVSLLKARKIAETTIEDIRDIIKDRQEEGSSYEDIARDIMGVAPALSSHRAATIAITETHTASMFAENTMTNMLAEDYEVDLLKTWLSAEDGRTRPAHSAANNQTVPMDGRFKVGGEMMEYPGDPRASLKNTIRCRCVQTYKMQDD
jgi:hypothetical protein